MEPSVEASRPVELPVEVWAQIISFITDSRYLPRTWLHFRRVSRAFKHATEMAFVSSHLPHADLIFREHRSSFHADLIFPKVVFKFDRLADGDQGRAVFVRKHPAESLREISVVADCGGGGGGGARDDNNLFDLTMRRWRETLEPYATHAARQQTPKSAPYAWRPHVLAVRRVANDTALPGLEVDYEKQEISVLWAPMLSLLFGEEEYIKWAKKVDYQHSSARRGMESMMRMVDSGEMPYDEVADLMWEFTTKRNFRVLNLVRRERLGRYEHNDQDLRDDALKRQVVVKAREDLEWANFADEFIYRGPEECKGCFYDGMGMKFQGKSEMNGPGEYLHVP
ncbi:hypothetical protein DL766_009214 [Monosporascus sp. MC13-8B]|uniref:F-box domain-containing protein n=1 Tax=Monosporascus cannonballus TaxID=155416 RepID=A0ABY0GW98_9PEZI|nr:hypothetical protein DL762_008741 [Monosporascus cannonballus]RYO96998.1 hypothetical protein DL763_002935 [Monosporascus cannonballus]RYP16134.1 hypothetical protein DL766_009214 [Monosporascus sp. MC13-8B]